MKQTVRYIALCLGILLILCACGRQEDVAFHSNTKEATPQEELTAENAAAYIDRQLSDTATVAGYYWGEKNQTYAPQGNRDFAAKFLTAIGSFEDWETATIEDITEAPEAEVYLYNDHHHISFLPYREKTYVEIMANDRAYAFSSETIDVNDMIAILNQYL